ncbi:MAG: class I SAM-dependent methyltransferase [Candidatus Hydrogenedentes bacterium]|nr:class I SAM-dependent methyltransferase [Candidatus Hydrogenedentota bacterium]
MFVKRSFFTTVDHAFEIQAVEEVDCNLCGASDYGVVTTENDFEVRECHDCGLVYVSPQPQSGELEKFYAGLYAESDADATSESSLGYVERHIRRIVARRCPHSGALLEIGCGRGGFLLAMRDTPFELSAIELDARAAAYAREAVPGVPIQESTIEAATVPEASQDAVVAIAVLEHVKDPRAVLRTMSAWLKPEGVLIVQVPRVTPFLKAKRWLPGIPIYFEAPRHLFDFSPDTLHRYFAELGYGDIRVEVARPYSSNGVVGLIGIWAVKGMGMVLHRLSRGRYMYPYAGAFVIHAYKRGDT